MEGNAKILWIARSFDDERSWIYSDRPHMDIDGYWGVDDRGNMTELCDNDAINLQPGECKMFIEFSPKVSDGKSNGSVLWWDSTDGTWNLRAGEYVDSGHVIIPVPPDPMPYLVPHPDPKKLRMAEIDAQIAELYAERAKLEDR